MSNSNNERFVNYLLRLPEILKKILHKKALANKRSLNSEIIYRLEQSTIITKKSKD